MSEYLATYDISHTSTRARVARLLLGYGVRIQHSVYHIELESSEVDGLKRSIGPMLSKDDRFDLLPVDRDPRRCRLAWQRALYEPAVVFL